jgi:hypothetical protein
MTNSGNLPADIRIVCAITHVDEITLDLCRQAIQRQTRVPSAIKVVSNVTPASRAFNECLEFALEENADILIHLAADCILNSDAIAMLVDRMDLKENYVTTGLGFDMFNGDNAPIGIWALNMRVISDRFRFRDAFKMDLDFCERIEAETGLTRNKTKKRVPLGCHHPIWLPREMFMKFRYNAAKYRGKEIRKYQEFFNACLAVNPDNKVLQLGLAGLKRGSAEPHEFGGPSRDAFAEEWDDAQSLVNIKGGEFFAYNSDFVKIATELLKTDEVVVPMAGPFFPDASISKEGMPTASEPSHAKSSSKSTPPAFHKRLKSKAKRVAENVRSDSIILARKVFEKLPNTTKNLLRKATGRKPILSLDVRIKKSEELPLGPYGSIVAGNSDWADKWAATAKSKRVLYVAPKDFAGSMYKWAEAVNRHTDMAARLITFEHHQYGYPVDLVVPECDENRLEKVLQIADEAGTLHLKDEHSWFLGLEHFTNLKLLNALFFGDDFSSKPKVFTHYGGYARKLKDDADYINTVSRFDARIAMTPDLNYAWFNGSYIPHTIDTEKIPFTWNDSKIFAHSPSSPEKKATYIFEEAVKLLPRQYPDVWSGWSIDLISGVSFAECMIRKQRASLFFDQAGRHRKADLGIDDVIGWYGNSAIEAMAFGIPTMAHMSDFALERAAASGVDLSDSPVINIERTRQSMIDNFIQFASAEVSERKSIAMKTREFTENFHGYHACAVRLADVYASLGKKIGS